MAGAFEQFQVAAAASLLDPLLEGYSGLNRYQSVLCAEEKERGRDVAGDVVKGRDFAIPLLNLRIAVASGTVVHHGVPKEQRVGLRPDGFVLRGIVQAWHQGSGGGDLTAG